ncbi:hypothetical protein GCM10027578_09270 [Spirosoma luteolum]
MGMRTIRLVSQTAFDTRRGSPPESDLPVCLQPPKTTRMSGKAGHLPPLRVGANGVKLVDPARKTKPACIKELAVRGLWVSNRDV